MQQQKSGIKKTKNSSQKVCMICMDKKATQEMFSSKHCTHSFCKDCIAQHVAAKIQQNTIEVKCPDINCKAVLGPKQCRSIVPEHVFEQWEKALCESSILPSQKFYCPFKDCSALLVDDGQEVVTASECPNCHRMFCAQCKVPWHAGISCHKFRKSKKIDEVKEYDKKVKMLAKENEWMRCPNCYYYVERTEGCKEIKCRCGYTFCYGCGSKWTSDHVCPPKPAKK